MLVLTRKKGQSIMLNDNIEISVLEVGDQVRIGINAPRSVKIFRKEIFEEIQEENKRAASVGKASLDNLIKKRNKKEDNIEHNHENHENHENEENEENEENKENKENKENNIKE